MKSLYDSALFEEQAASPCDSFRTSNRVPNRSGACRLSSAFHVSKNVPPIIQQWKGRFETMRVAGIRNTGVAASGRPHQGPARRKGLVPRTACRTCVDTAQLRGGPGARTPEPVGSDAGERRECSWRLAVRVVGGGDEEADPIVLAQFAGAGRGQLRLTPKVVTLHRAGLGRKMRQSNRQPAPVPALRTSASSPWW